VGRTVVLDSRDGVVLKEASGKEYLDAMTGTPLYQQNSHEDLTNVTLLQVSSTLGNLVLLLTHQKDVEVGTFSRPA
jgi:hypothetical protein